MLREDEVSTGDRASRILTELIREKGLRRYGLFYVTGEGEAFPDGTESASGYVVDSHGRVFFFWLGWDHGRGLPCLVQWDEADQATTDRSDPEYRQACEAAGLSFD